MKHAPIIISILSVMLSVPVLAGQSEYDDCILKHLKGVKLDVAARVIKRACEENYGSPSFTSDKRRAYNNCLLEHLSGVESIQAMMDIKGACYRKHD